MQSLPTSIIRFESLGSTNTEAASWAMQGSPEGLCIVADEQTAGRGRLERRWLSPKGAGLYCSVVLRPHISQRSLPLITLMTSLAVHDALLESCGLETDIKWPNDVLADGRKLCGILAEVIETTLGRAVIVGIGINLSKERLLNELTQTATSVESVTGARPDRDQLLDVLLQTLNRHYVVLQGTGGEAATVQHWCQLSTFAENKRVRVENSGESIEGFTRGLELDGALRLETDDGQIHLVRAGDVTAVRPAIDNASNAST
jgi:BirA family biotin operon repressor/biotin-[acetyl-CoA-carboxylase] ligase